MEELQVVDGYDIDDDPARIDRAVVWAFLSRHAYWGRWRDRGVLERQLDGAWRLVGAYERATGSMVGFARAVSDGEALAYLADVFVLDGHRGRGLGRAIVAAMIDGGPGSDFRWLLHTRDPAFYVGAGFGPPPATCLERPAEPGKPSLGMPA